MHTIPRHRRPKFHSAEAAGALNSKSLWQHQKSAVCVANDLGLLTLVPPMVISDQGAEQGIEPILRFLGIGGSEQFFAHDSGKQFGEPALETAAQERLIAAKLPPAFGHRTTLVFENSRQPKPTDHGRMRIDFHGQLCGRQIPAERITFRLQRPGNAQRPGAKTGIGGVTPGVLSPEESMG